jgi:hypothetical protein
MADKALIMTVPCQRAFSARRFVAQIGNHDRFPDVFAQAEKWFHLAGVLFRQSRRTKQNRPSR